jgi:phage terminase large subunit
MGQPLKLTITTRTFNAAYLPYLYNKPEGKHRTMVFYGGAGSGKSKFVVQNAILKGLASKRKFLVTRKVDNTIRDSIFQEFITCLSEYNILGMCDVKASYMTIVLPNGTKYIFKGMEDPERIKSISGITDIIIEEASEFNLDDYSQLQLRLRKDENGQVFIMYNPSSKANWTYQMFHNPATKRPEDCKVVCTTFKDNRFLPSTYIKQLQDMKHTNPVYYEIYAMGKFASLGKRIYTNWERARLDLREIYKAGWEPRFGVDFGFSNDPSVILSVMVNPQAKLIYVYDEYVKKGMIGAEIYKQMERMKILNHKIFADSSNLATIEEIRRLGARRIKPVKKGADSIVHGIQYLQGFKIIVDPRCVETIKELENYEWKPVKGVADEYENKPLQNGFDHCMDALRYSVNDLIPRNRISTISKSVLGL